MSNYVVAEEDGATRVRILRSAVVIGLADLPCPDAATVVYDFADLHLISSPMVGSLFRVLRSRGNRRTVLRVSKGNHAILKLLGITKLPNIMVDIEIVPSPAERGETDAPR